MTRALALLFLAACTAPQRAPAPSAPPFAPAAAAPAPAPTVLVLPPIIITGAPVRRATAPEAERVHERVFCDRWASGSVICDSYRY
jgi:hypothetical protein